jgi:hypothetical protein
LNSTKEQPNTTSTHSTAERKTANFVAYIQHFEHIATYIHHDRDKHSIDIHQNFIKFAYNGCLVINKLINPRHQVVHDRPTSQLDFTIAKHRYFHVWMSRPELVNIAMVTLAQKVFSDFGRFCGVTLTSTEFARAKKNEIGDALQGMKLGFWNVDTELR